MHFAPCIAAFEPRIPLADQVDPAVILLSTIADWRVRGVFVNIRGRLLACSSVAILTVALGTPAVLASTLAPACGHANLNNPGNHYGLIKNGCVQQPPPPSPSPVPPPPPTAHPSPVPSPKPVSSGATNTAANGANGISDASEGRSMAPDLAPAPLDLTGPPSRAVRANAHVTSSAPNWWDAIGLVGWALILLLLIALAAIVYLRRRQQGTATPSH